MRIFWLVFLFLITSVSAQAENSLPKCQGKDYTKWTNCYGEAKWPRGEYKGEWKEGRLEGKGVFIEAWGLSLIHI